MQGPSLLGVRRIWFGNLISPLQSHLCLTFLWHDLKLPSLPTDSNETIELDAVSMHTNCLCMWSYAHDSNAGRHSSCRQVYWSWNQNHLVWNYSFIYSFIYVTCLIHLICKKKIIIKKKMWAPWWLYILHHVLDVCFILFQFIMVTIKTSWQVLECMSVDVFLFLFEKAIFTEEH